VDTEAALTGHCSYNLIQLPSKWREQFPLKSRQQRCNNSEKKKTIIWEKSVVKFWKIIQIVLLVKLNPAGKKFEFHRSRLIQHHHFNVIHSPASQCCLSYCPPIKGWLPGRLSGARDRSRTEFKYMCNSEAQFNLFNSESAPLAARGTLMFNPSHLPPISSTSVCGQATVCTNFICHASTLPLRICASALNTNSIHNLSWSALWQLH